jgi:hypothetical protein
MFPRGYRSDIEPALPRIAITRIDEIDREHFFGVTRHRTHDNNHSDKIIHFLVKTNVAAQLGQKFGRFCDGNVLAVLGCI